MTEAWTLKGEMALSCSCTEFSPCVISLGNRPPTEGGCQTWAGVRIDEGHFHTINLASLKVGLMMDLPGIMARGNWTVALCIDDKAPIHAAKGLTRILTGRVGGTTHLLSILVGQFLGLHRVPISYEAQGDTRVINIDTYGGVAISPIRGKQAGEPALVSNSECWVGSEVIVSRADRSRFRGFGRNRHLAGRSAEIVKLDWGNQ